MGDVCASIKDGLHNLPKNSIDYNHPILSAQNIDSGAINFNATRFVDDEVFMKEKRRTNIEPGDVLLTIVATIGRTAIVEERCDFLLQRSVCALKPKEIINSSFLRYYLDSSSVQQYMKVNAHGSAQAGLYLKQVAGIKVPVPPLKTQMKIASIIDKFHMLCGDIVSGLPAEIEGRHKQYEYYRDKLLTFEAKTA